MFSINIKLLTIFLLTKIHKSHNLTDNIGRNVVFRSEPWKATRAKSPVTCCLHVPRESLEVLNTCQRGLQYFWSKILTTVIFVSYSACLMCIFRIKGRKHPRHMFLMLLHDSYCIVACITHHLMTFIALGSQQLTPSC